MRVESRTGEPVRRPKITSGKAGDKCLFPHYKVDEEPNKKPKTSYYPQDSDALVSQGTTWISTEQGNLIRSSVFRNANPSNLRGSLLDGNKDHLLNQARSDLAKQELHVESLKKCIGELQRQTEAQRLA